MKTARRVGVILVFVLWTARLAHAQQPSVTAGVEVGVNTSRISPDVGDESISRGFGLFVGGYVLIPAFQSVGIQLEGIYTQKRTHLGNSQDLVLDYLEVPVLAKLPLFKGLYIVHGLAFDFPVSAHLEPTASAAIDIKSQVTSPDVGLVIGVAYPVDRVHIEGRFEGGFRSVYSTADAPTQRSRTFTFLVRFPF
jgi:hypothetical protein